ncbi:type II toxin-antitoxin system VapC family toxin [Glacieibacterium sp.]|uniref:type II toxin-antitoxin system VapC family toxin n=1 Tax=Glacieibacterium sp. TaxID=2860237 RepID=UPI003AFFAF27
MAEPRYLLDSNIAIYILKGVAPLAQARVEASDLGSIVTSSVCLAEMLIGLLDREREALDRLLLQIDTLPFDEAAARRYADLPFKRRSYDRLIGAHALSLGLTVVTANSGDFDDIPGLRVENWTVA